MFVNKIWSSKTQLPYNYYSLPFCKPERVETEKENIGQILIGDRIQNSDYQVSFEELCDLSLASAVRLCNRFIHKAVIES